MGMEHRVSFAGEISPNWEAIAKLLADCNYPVQMRMIDGELVFPDQSPPAQWRELRVGTEAGMVTLKRDGNSIALVTWGNVEAEMVKAWNALTWAVAKTVSGSITAGEKTYSPEEFRNESDLPQQFQLP